MLWFIRGVTALSRAAATVASIMIVVAALVVCQMVFMRYVMGTSTIWQTEFVTFMLLGATLLASPYVLHERGHVNVDLLPMLLGPRGKLALALISNFIAFAFIVIVAYTGFMLWLEYFETGWRSESVWRPRLWIPMTFLPLGMILLALQYIAQTAAIVMGVEEPFTLEAEQILKEESESQGSADSNADKGHPAVAQARHVVDAHGGKEK